MRARILMIVALVAVGTAALAFTKPGRAVLTQIGLAKACSSEGNCD